MAWEARLGLKHAKLSEVKELAERLNGLGSPSGFETNMCYCLSGGIPRLNGLGSPSGFEGQKDTHEIPSWVFCFLSRFSLSDCHVAL